MLKKGGFEMKKILFGILVSLVIFSQMASAGLDVGAIYVSKYIWRGFDLNGTQPGIQPGIDYAIPDSNFTLSFWGNYNVGGLTKKEFTEADLVVDYSSSIKEGIDYSVGFTYYTFPNLTGLAAKSHEPYVGITFSKLVFTPAVTVYYDYDQGNGVYATLAGGYDFNLGSQPMSSGLTIGYNGGQWGATSGISDIVLALSTEFEMKCTTVSPSLGYAIIPNGTNTFWFGLGVSL